MSLVLILSVGNEFGYRGCSEASTYMRLESVLLVLASSSKDPSPLHVWFVLLRPFNTDRSVISACSLLSLLAPHLRPPKPQPLPLSSLAKFKGREQAYSLSIRISLSILLNIHIMLPIRSDQPFHLSTEFRDSLGGSGRMRRRDI